jgi:protocatechuate 3,4-dioxygenase alpha subunit
MTYSKTKSNLLTATNEDTVGPYYPISLSNQASMDLTTTQMGIKYKAQGQKIVLKGTIIDRYDQLAHGSLLEFWQPNANGIYRTPDTETHAFLDPWFIGHTRYRTPDGRFELTTVKPGICQQMEQPRAPNITLTIFSDGIMRVVTQIFFEDESTNKDDPLLQSLPKELRSRLIAKYDGQTEDGNKTYKIDIRMSGEKETPFFDDLSS